MAFFEAETGLGPERVPVAGATWEHPVPPLMSEETPGDLFTRFK